MLASRRFQGTRHPGPEKQELEEALSLAKAKQRASWAEEEGAVGA